MKRFPDLTCFLNPTRVRSRNFSKPLCRSSAVNALLVLASTLLLSGSASAFDFEVRTCSVTVTIDASGFFDVEEYYEINFRVPRHGIYRDVQTRYEVRDANGQVSDRNIRLSNIEVPDHPFEVTSRFAQRFEGKARIKIGSASRLVDGLQVYRIHYRVHHAFVFEPDADLFYWNIKPPDWQTDFENIHFSIHLPDGVLPYQDDCFIYSGVVGATGDGGFSSSVNGQVFSGDSPEGFHSGPGASVTVLIRMPPGSVARRGELAKAWADYGWIVILFLAILLFYMLWKKYGKDTDLPTMTAYFPPDNLDPALTGYLFDDNPDTNDIISLLPYWASRGILRMEEIPKEGWFGKTDTRLIKRADLPDASPKYQSTVFSKLFSSGDEVRISSLKNKFYTVMGKARKELKDAARKYYDPTASRIALFMGFILFLLIPASFFFMIYFFGILAGFTSAVVFVVLLILNKYMIRKNKIGDRLYAEIKGFQRFVKIAEEQKLRMLLQQDPSYFEKTLSYAVAFGLLSSWTDKFKGLDVPPPGWYSSTSGSSFNMALFSDSFSSAVSSAQSTMVSSPSSGGSSSGGGSSGGGFGGGGGGSW